MIHIIIIIIKISIILQEAKAFGTAWFTHSVLACRQQTQAVGGGIS